MAKRLFLILLIGIPLLCVLGVILYNLPPIHERLAWRVDGLRAQIRRALNPPEEVVFVPQEMVDAIVQATLQALTPSPGIEITEEPTGPTPGLTTTPAPTATLVPTPLPVSVNLPGFTHEYQNFNNCGPATLSMTLSYWDWGGDQNVARAILRPNYEEDDKNVNPWEMVAFVEGETDLNALTRVGGDLETLKRFTAAGFPVLIEKGLHPDDDYWLGHYQLIAGYDDANRQVIVYDSFQGPDHDYPVPYGVVEEYWPHFNNVYIVPYPPEREAEVMALLGPHADPVYNNQATAQRALEQAAVLTGRNQFFAWFNRGSSFVALGDYPAAAEAYDTAFAAYATLTEAERPWRVMWYLDGPYAAYYHTGRYQDVIDLAQITLTHVDKPVLEETYYWRGMAREAIGDREDAIADLQRAASLNPNSTEALAELQRMGVESP
jgi:Peptidase_C39 like family/Tetratricopeptide repeat